MTGVLNLGSLLDILEKAKIFKNSGNADKGIVDKFSERLHGLIVKAMNLAVPDLWRDLDTDYVGSCVSHDNIQTENRDGKKLCYLAGHATSAQLFYAPYSKPGAEKISLVELKDLSTLSDEQAQIAADQKIPTTASLWIETSLEDASQKNSNLPRLKSDEISLSDVISQAKDGPNKELAKSILSFVVKAWSRVEVK